MSGATFDGFVTASNGTIVDGRGHPILLRGVGLGNWLLPEGYMWHLSPGRESPREIEALVTELVGQDRAQEFWDRFLDDFISRRDIEQIAREGFNHVRLPINWRHVINPDATMRPQGLAVIDRLINWCTRHGLWVLLDLHGAPGGQTGTNIDDSNGRPELFMDLSNQDLTVALWQQLAARYKDNTTVLGYDVLNEPLPNHWQHVYPNQLVDLYRRITAAIRDVDRNHVIMYEGTHWSTNWDIFTEVWDPNSVLQFHRYWLPPDRPSIQRYIDIRQSLGIPIYMGESGENNTDWLATAFQLYEDCNIGWNFWPWKKMNTFTSPCSIEPPPGWENIVAYGNGEADSPQPDDAWDVLEDLLSRAAFERCTYRPDVVNALFRRAPISMPATGFGFKGKGRSYSTGNGHPLSRFRPDDSVTVLYAGHATEITPTFDHNDGRPRPPEEQLAVVLEPCDWVTYDIEIPRMAEWRIVMITEPQFDSIPSVEIDGSIIAVRHTGEGRWVSEDDPRLAAGRCLVRIRANKGGLGFIRLEVEEPESRLIDGQ